jgi:hypothetical protein
VLLLGGYQTALAFTTLDRVASWSAWTNAFYFTDGSGRGYLRTQEGNGGVAYFWTFGSEMEIVNAAVPLGLASTNMVNALCAGFTNENGLDWSWDSYNDDVTGVARAFVGAFQVTGNTNWLMLAKYGFDLGYSRGFVSTNGGILECTSGCTETAETVDGIIVPCYWLAQYLPDPTYLTKAQNLYGFLITNEFVRATGMVEGEPSSGISSTASSDYGFFIQDSILLGYTNNAYLAASYATNNFGLVLTGPGGSAGFCLRAMGLTGIDTAFAQAACDNAWSWRNSRGLSEQWTYRENDTNAVQSYNAMDVVMGMLSVPPTMPPTLPVTAVDIVGSQVTFTTAGFGGANLAYQWQMIRSGVTSNLPGATNITLTLTNLQLANSASYQLLASNASGISVSIPGSLTVSNVPSAVNNVITSFAAQTGLPYGFAFTPTWTLAPGSLIGGLSAGSTNGNFNLDPYYLNRNVSSLTAGGSLVLVPEGNDGSSYDFYTATFKATSSTINLAFVGTDLAGGDNTIFIDDVQIVSSSGTSVAVPDLGFETPSLGTGNFQYNPGGGSWTFSGGSPNGSGIVANGSAFGNPNAPEGTQAAFVQEHGTVSQSISGFSAGTTYTLSFAAAQRPGNSQSWNVTVNGTVVGSYNAGSSVITSSNYVTCGSGAGSNLVYTLTGSAQGFDLTNLTVYGGWADGARDAQAYTVYYSTVAAPADFIPLGSVSYTPVNTNYNPLYVSYGSVPGATRATLTPATGWLATNVAAVEFNFATPAGENGYEGYAQIALYGLPATPELTQNTLPVTAVDVVGSQVTFTAAVAAANPLAYQWQMVSGGVTNNIPGATNTTLTLLNLQLTNTAAYQLQASNNYGVVVTAPGSLAVSNLPAAVNNVITAYAAQTGLGSTLTNFVPTWTVAPGSLIAGQLPGSMGGGNFNEYYSGTVGVLTDGTFGWLNYWPAVGSSPTEVTCGTVASGAGQSVTYTLAGSTNGYTLTNIVVYGGWGDAGRDQQAYTVYYSTVAAPATFLSLDTVNYLPSNPAAVQCATRATLTPVSGVLASNVAGVKFNFTAPAGENGFEGYSEIDLYGAATPVPPATNPTNLTLQVSSASLTLNWPANHIGWQLQSQTNNLNQGLGTNWSEVSGSTTTNQMLIPINPTNGSVFYRLEYNP